MKTLINKTLLFGLASLMLWSCKKEETKVIAGAGEAGAISASKTTIVLTKNDASTNAVTFTWKAADFGFSSAPEYILEIGKKGSNFAGAQSKNISGNLNQTFNGSDLNNLALALELQPEQASEVEVRVKAQLGTIDPVYSNVISLTITPYFDLVDYPSLWVPGAHQGWDPPTAPKISSITNNNIYEGYIYFPNNEQVNEFKFSPVPKWEGDFGGTVTGTNSGVLVGGDNLKITGAGYYLLEANRVANTWKATKTTWGIIGDATPSGWDSDTDMTYDAVNKVWKLTAVLTGDKQWKFRANDAWDINFGSTLNNDGEQKALNGSIKVNGKNIGVAITGTYEITLNLSTPGNYRYTLKKL